MLIIDFLLLALITVSIVYCWVLNRRIQDLQNSRIEFARMIKELNISILKAESSVNELNHLSKVTTNELKNSIEEAHHIANELMMVNDLGNNLSSQLSEQFNIIKKEQDTYFSAANNEPVLKEKSRFSEEDFAPIVETRSTYKSFYKNQLKNLLTTIVGKKEEEDNISMDQTSYYDSLRKISVKK